MKVIRADVLCPYNGDKKVDLLLVPHATNVCETPVGTDLGIEISDILDIHGSHLKKNGLIVTAGQLNGHQLIYNSRDKIVSQLRTYGNQGYYGANLRKSI